MLRVPVTVPAGCYEVLLADAEGGRSGGAAVDRAGNGEFR